MNQVDTDKEESTDFEIDWRSRGQTWIAVAILTSVLATMVWSVILARFFDETTNHVSADAFFRSLPTYMAMVVASLSLLLCLGSMMAAVGCFVCEAIHDSRQ